MTFISPIGKKPKAKHSGHSILADVDSLAVFESSSVLMPNIWGSAVMNNPAITRQVQSVRTALIPIETEYFKRLHQSYLNMHFNLIKWKGIVQIYCAYDN